jgi:rod shape determining protein RodA
MVKMFDWWLIGATALLLGMGLVIQVSIAPESLPVHIFYIGAGLVAFFLAQSVNPRLYSLLAKYLFAGSILFLLVPILIGIESRGAVRWIPLGPFTLQPSELVKPFLLIGFAKYFSTRQLVKVSEIILGLILVAVPVTIVFFQPDLGSSLVLGAGWLSIVILAGIPGKWLVGAAAIAAAVIPGMWFILKDYQKSRLSAFISPHSDPLGSGYNVLQAVIAAGSGQLTGRGLGRGTQSHLRFLPENHTDFVYASLSEELGLIGVAILFFGYGLICWRLVSIASQTESRFGKLLAAGIAGMIFFQMFINIGMNLGILPVTGIPLPLVSYGGSSLVSTLFALGVAQSLNRGAKTVRPFLIS